MERTTNGKEKKRKYAQNRFLKEDFRGARIELRIIDIAT